MKHTFVKNKEAEVLECEVCGYVWGQEEKRGCKKEDHVLKELKGGLENNGIFNKPRLEQTR